MLLCHISDIQEGMVVGASVLHPTSPDMELLKTGKVLDEALIGRLRGLGIERMWIEHDITSDLDNAVEAQLSGAKLEMMTALKKDLTTAAGRTLGAAQVHEYRRVILEMVLVLMSSKQLAGLTDALFSIEQNLMTHCTNVAYLSVMIGLEQETYIMRERPRLEPRHAFDLVALGLAGMLHDIGKATADASVQSIHEVHAAAEGLEGAALDAYKEHAAAGYEAVRYTHAPAAVMQSVLNHHQHFDGSGWPAIDLPARDPSCGKQRETRPRIGREIHIFTRIVSAANLLDNLMRDAEGHHRPAVAALRTFMGDEYDGWLDPRIRSGLLRCVPPFNVGSDVRLSDGARAVVVAPCMMAPCRPTVRALAKSGSEDETTIALADRPDLHIVSHLGEPVEEWLYDLPPEQPLREGHAA
jgi:HD-GYP domain-containing protein (c-di-GMP phosphodiesterase class II)